MRILSSFPQGKFAEICLAGGVPDPWLALDSPSLLHMLWTVSIASMLAKALKAFINHADSAGHAAWAAAFAAHETLHPFCNRSLWMGRNLMKKQPHKICINRLTSDPAGVKSSSFFDTYFSFRGW